MYQNNPIQIANHINNINNITYNINNINNKRVLQSNNNNNNGVSMGSVQVQRYDKLSPQ